MTETATLAAPVMETADSAIKSIISEVVPQSLGETTEQPQGEQPRDEKGRFVPKGEEPTVEGEPSVEPPIGDESTATDGSENDAPPALPEGYVAVPKIEGRELATQFKVADRDGELEPPDLTITFTAAGKERTEPLDKVIRMAQFGYHNEERERNIEAARTEVQQTTARAQEIEQYARTLERKLETLLSDDNAYLSERAAFEAQNTPEAREQRVRAMEVEQQERTAFRSAADLGQQFFASEVEPSIGKILEVCSTVSPEEIAAKSLLITNRFLVPTRFGAIVPPTAYQHVRQALASELVPWAQHIHETRTSERTAAERKADAERAELAKKAAQAQAEAQKTKNTLTRSAKPNQGKAVPDQGPPKKPIVTADDAIADITKDAVRAALNAA